MTFRKICAVFLMAILFAFLSLGAYVLSVAFWPSKYSFSTDGLVTIRPGYSSSDLLREFANKRIITHSVFLPFLTRRMIKRYGQIKFGEYRLPDGISFYRAMKAVIDYEVYFRRVTIVEGETFEGVTNCINTAYGLFGRDVTVSDIGPLGVMPDTYLYAFGESKKAILSRMRTSLNRFLAKHMPLKGDGCTLKTKLEVVTMASIIEKETSLDAERSIVSSVYFNRLEKRMKLDADPCIRFITKNKTLLRSDFFIKSPYNTYRNRGLPPGPICMSGKKSILAALHPEKTNYLFFVVNKDGTHNFSTNFKEHRIKRAAFLKRWNNEKDS